MRRRLTALLVCGAVSAAGACSSAPAPTVPSPPGAPPAATPPIHVTSDAILLEDGATTSLRPESVSFRQATRGDGLDVPHEQLQWHGVLEVGGTVAATGGILFHYNRPYGDIYMQVHEPYRRRGLGSYLVQELKRVCYAGGHLPAARCNTSNLASRQTLQKAGFVPCGHILKGAVRAER